MDILADEIRLDLVPSPIVSHEERKRGHVERLGIQDCQAEKRGLVDGWSCDHDLIVFFRNAFGKKEEGLCPVEDLFGKREAAICLSMKESEELLCKSFFSFRRDAFQVLIEEEEKKTSLLFLC